MDARRLAGQLAVSVTSAADACNRAVMANTEESSRTSVDEAQAHARAADQTLAQLDTLLHSLRYSAELELLEQVRQALQKSHTLDAELLGLAVEGTNLKAQTISFGPARAAADSFRAALERAAQAASAKVRAEVNVLTLTAALAVREIEVLEGPHIAASDADAMSALEKQMTLLLARARHSLEELEKLREPVWAQTFAQANDALDHFVGLHQQVLALSRRNSNTRSLALALGQKRALTAAVEASIQQLIADLDKRGLTATR